jgi:hypothetical protein
MDPPGAELLEAKQVVGDVAWLATHGSYVQAAKRLAEVLWSVERHVREIDRVLQSSSLGRRRLSAADVLRIREEHRRLLQLVQAAQACVSRSDSRRGEAYLRKLARSLGLHEQRNHSLLSGAPRLAPSAKRTQ